MKGHVRISGSDLNSFLRLWLSAPSGLLVVFEKPKRSSLTCTSEKENTALWKAGTASLVSPLPPPPRNRHGRLLQAWTTRATWSTLLGRKVVCTAHTTTSLTSPPAAMPAFTSARFPATADANT